MEMVIHLWLYMGKIISVDASENRREVLPRLFKSFEVFWSYEANLELIVCNDSYWGNGNLLAVIYDTIRVKIIHKEDNKK